MSFQIPPFILYPLVDEAPAITKVIIKANIGWSYLEKFQNIIKKSSYLVKASANPTSATQPYSDTGMDCPVNKSIARTNTFFTTDHIITMIVPKNHRTAVAHIKQSALMNNNILITYKFF